jgi:hypothetical protein
MLAKQDTPMNARRTLLGCVPAKLKTRVIKTRSMLVLLNAEEIVKPPMSNMIVGENIAEKTNLQIIFQSDRLYQSFNVFVAYFVAAGGAI